MAGIAIRLVYWIQKQRASSSGMRAAELERMMKQQRERVPARTLYGGVQLKLRQAGGGARSRFLEVRTQGPEPDVFVQSEGGVPQDNTVVLRNRCLQQEKTQFRNTLTGGTVTLCEHVDGSVTVRWGPHLLTIDAC